MTDRIIGPSGSRRRRRLKLWLPLVAILALVVPGLVSAVPLPPVPPAVNSPQFEFDDNVSGVNGILTDDAATDGTLDWDNHNQDGTTRPGDPVIVASRNSDGTCTQTNLPATAGGPGSIGSGLLICDGSAGNFTDRDHFTGGSKNEGTAWSIVGGSNPKKGDFSELMLYAKFGDSTADGDLDPDDLFLFSGQTRLDVNGSTHLDIELNHQNAKTGCPDTDPGPDVDISNCTPTRTLGDLIVAVDYERGGIPIVRVFQYQSTGLCANDPQVTNPCFVQKTGVGNAAVGVFNSEQGTFGASSPFHGEIQGPIWNAVGCERTSDDNSPGCRIRDDVPAFGFLETFTDLAAFNIDVTCPGFSNLVFKTRSSNALNSELKDDAEAQINISKCSIAWEKRDDLGNLQGGATFTVGQGANPANGDGNGPFACLDSNNTGADDNNPVTIADNGANDGDPDAGQLLLDNVCFGTYTVTETVGPGGFAKDSDTTRVVVVNNANQNPVIGAQGSDDKTGTALCDASSDECDFHNRLGTVSWEKRDQTVGITGDPAPGNHALQGGATFTVGQGANPANGDGNGPFACQDSNNTGADDNNPVTVVDNSAPDVDPDAGQLKLSRVCLGSYVITETVAPTGYLADLDTTRAVSVTESALDAVVGTALTAPPSTDDEGTRNNNGECTDNACDFHNRKGSLLIRKEAKDASTEATNDLLGGASFKITPNPFTGTGDLTVVDDDSNDSFGTSAGLICLNNARTGITYSVQELSAPAHYKKADPDTQSGISASTQSCSERGTSSTADVTFVNMPLSTIEVIFTSLAGPDVTKASIVCSDGTSTVPAVSENGSADPALDDSDEAFGNDSTTLVPGTYTCTVVIDP